MPGGSLIRLVVRIPVQATRPSTWGRARRLPQAQGQLGRAVGIDRGASVPRLHECFGRERRPEARLEFVVFDLLVGSDREADLAMDRHRGAEQRRGARRVPRINTELPGMAEKEGLRASAAFYWMGCLLGGPREGDLMIVRRHRTSIITASG